MTSPLRHEFIRTMRSKSIIVSMIEIIALSLGLVPLANLASSTVVMYSGGTPVVGYYDAPDYHFLAFSYNGYGQPVQGTSVNITITGPAGSHSSTASTNSSGFAVWSMPGDGPGTSVFYSFRAGALQGGQGSFAPGYRTGDTISFGSGTLALVTDPSNSSRREAIFVYEGANGTSPSSYRVYYNYSSTSSPFMGVVNESQYEFLGTPTSFATVFRLPPPPAGTTSLALAAFDSNGTLVTGFSEITQGGTLVPPNPKELFATFTSSILALVVPLMAILVTYNTYGKDRATGVLESVIARPVTRRGLALSRYASILISMSLALVITVAAMEGISQALIGATLPADFALYTIGALVVEAAAFTGLMMLLSQFVKSTGALIGVGVGLWILLDFFWGVLTLVGSALLGVQIGSGDYLALTIESAFFNPAQFYSLVGEFIGGVSITSSAGTQIPISPATYGLTYYSIAAAAAFWVFVPLALFIYLVTRRD